MNELDWGVDEVGTRGDENVAIVDSVVVADLLFLISLQLLLVSGDLFLLADLIFQFAHLGLSLVVLSAVLFADVFVLLLDHLLLLLHLTTQLLLIHSGTRHDSQSGANQNELETHFSNSDLFEI